MAIGFDRLFILAAKNRLTLIRLFQIVYVFIALLLFIGGHSIYALDANYPFFYSLGLGLGKTAIIIYSLTLLPGIAERLGVRHPLFNILMMFRRYLGITMYLLVFTHFWWMLGIHWLFLRTITFPFPLFEMISFLAFIFLSAMVVFSNDRMERKFGSLWKRVHRITYVVAWLIFLHVALQRMSVWTLIMGGMSVLVVLSWIIFYGKNIRQGETS